MAEIYDNQDKFIERVIKITGADTSAKFPKEFSACLEEKIFMSVSPELYSQIYPDDIERDAFKKLIIHEINGT